MLGLEGFRELLHADHVAVVDGGDGQGLGAKADAAEGHAGEGKQSFYRRLHRALLFCTRRVTEGQLLFLCLPKAGRICADYSLQSRTRQIISRTLIDTFLHWGLKVQTQGRGFQRGSDIEYVQVSSLNAVPGASLRPQVVQESAQVLFGQSLHHQSPVVRRRHALELLKAPVEIGNVVET
ncbi:hypothetical protein D3C87_1409970 [compost metagenome]